MSFNAGCAEQLTSTAKRYARISRLLELESSSVRQSALNLIRTARRYIEKLNMPSTLQAAGVNAAEFEEAVHDHGGGGPGRPLHRHEPQKLHGGGN